MAGHARAFVFPVFAGQGMNIAVADGTGHDMDLYLFISWFVDQDFFNNDIPIITHTGHKSSFAFHGDDFLS